MYEDRPEKDTPQRIQDDLREYGGLSPDGQPIWRMVLAENCRVHYFGRQNYIMGGRIEAIKDDTRPTEIVPYRIEEGEFWMPRYKFTGWILQRWFPAMTWGTREKWEGERAQDGRTRLFAAYPQRGDYMMMPGGPWKTIAEAGDLRAQIRCYNAQQRANPVNWENSMLAYAALDAQQRQEEAETFAEELESQYREGYSGILRTASKSAQQVRDVIAAQTAGGINFGASEKWG